MPTPYGSQGGMAFSADELRVLRRALALALHPSPVPAQDVQQCVRLASSVDEAVRESGRLRAFLHADLARYRRCLPGSASGYLELLQSVLASGHRLRPEDLAALRTLRGHPVATALLAHCESRTAGQKHADHRAEPRRSSTPASERPAPAAPTGPAAPAAPAEPVRAHAPARLRALPGGRAAGDRPQPPSRPNTPADRPTGPRPVPTPAEAFPPKRRPAAPAEKQAG
ncbi:hypothetical protein [Streptomyces sp. NPDC060194]|uniref:hypothetical protein n=1 Tax=Streptomyces sp. NPDC060194 TaxID=3347069 RepID=UPI003653F824